MIIDSGGQPWPPPCVVEAVRRLRDEFAGRRSADEIRRTVTACFRDLCHAGVPEGSFGELVERSARERLGPGREPPEASPDFPLDRWYETGRRAAARPRSRI